MATRRRRGGSVSGHGEALPQRESQVAGRPASVSAFSISLRKYLQCSGDCLPNFFPEAPSGGTPASCNSQADSGIWLRRCSVWTGAVQPGCPRCLPGPGSHLSSTSTMFPPNSTSITSLPSFPPMPPLSSTTPTGKTLLLNTTVPPPLPKTTAPPPLPSTTALPPLPSTTAPTQQRHWQHHQPPQPLHQLTPHQPTQPQPTPHDQLKPQPALAPAQSAPAPFPAQPVPAPPESAPPPVPAESAPLPAIGWSTPECPRQAGGASKADVAAVPAEAESSQSRDRPGVKRQSCP